MDDKVPQASIERPTMFTPEGVREIEERIFDSVSARLDEAMGNAISEAREEVSRQFKDAVRLAVGEASASYKDALFKINEQAELAIKAITDQAERRLAHATELVKQAMKIGVDLEGQINKLQGRLAEITAKVEAEARDRIEDEVAKVRSTAEKYKRHIDLAGETMTKVSNQVLAFQEELKPFKRFLEDCAANGISPQSLHALAVQVASLGAARDGNGRGGKKPWHDRDRRAR